MQLFLSKKAEKEFGKLPRVEQSKMVKKLGLLEKNPLVGKKLAGELVNMRSLRVWPYRLIYHIDLVKKEVWIDSIIHRQSAYKH